MQKLLLDIPELKLFCQSFTCSMSRQLYWH